MGMVEVSRELTTKAGRPEGLGCKVWEGAGGGKVGERGTC